jgi:protein SCO1/2
MKYPVLLLCLFGSAVASAATGEAEPQGLRVEPPKAIRGATLVNQDGRATAFPLQSGKWQLAFFGYTHCPDVCPMTLHKTTQLLKVLGEEAARVQPVFITIDSQRDNPRAVGEFTGKFDKRVVGLTGEVETLQNVANEFGVLTRRFQGKTALAYTLEHSSFLYLLDPAGQVRSMYPATAEVAGMALDLRQVLGETRPR